jgi:4-hydroxythreonine-4-phosphate dehydrogenase
MTNTNEPIIIITMGDPAGIGPEIAIKSLINPEIHGLCRPILIGTLKSLQKTAMHLNLDIAFKAIPAPGYAKGKTGTIEVIDLNNVDTEKLKTGIMSAEAGRASIEYIEKAVNYALQGECEAIVTAPINKKAISLAGSRHIGHTELIAALSNVKDPLTMFSVRGLRIFFLTRHLSLKDAVRAVKKDSIIETTVKIAQALARIGLADPYIAIAALNPHASDEGLMGTEEAKEIYPAVKELRNMGLNVDGPVPADSVFHQAVEGKYEAILSMYHDQGHIAAKTLDFYGTVSVTLGLPFIRTSVDHGTAYDIAGKGVVNAKSLEEATKLAAKLVASSSRASGPD